jgi:hypothetical protein
VRTPEERLAASAWEHRGSGHIEWLPSLADFLPVTCIDCPHCGAKVSHFPDHLYSRHQDVLREFWKARDVTEQEAT